eukprot:403334120
MFSCHFSERQYALLLISDFVLLSIIPCQKLFAITPQREYHAVDAQYSTATDTQDASDYLDTLNIFKQLTTQPSFLIVTDIFNGISLLIILKILYVFIRVVNMEKNKFKSNIGQSGGSSGSSSGSEFSRIQISAINCYFNFNELSCGIQTDSARLITNSLGIILSISLIFYEYRLTGTIFPDKNMPWAKLESRYELVNRFLILYNICALVFQDSLLERFGFYIILIPPAIISLFMVWFSVKQIKYYSSWVDNSHLIKDVAICNFYIFQISIDSINSKNNQEDTISQQDQAYIVLVFMSLILMAVVIIIRKRNQNLDNFQIENPSQLLKQFQNIVISNHQNSKSVGANHHIYDHQPSWKIYALLKLIDSNMSQNINDDWVAVDLKLQSMLEQHRAFCENSKCRCKSQEQDFLDSDEQSNLLIENIEQTIQTQNISEVQDEQKQRKVRNELLMKLLISKLKNSSNRKIICYLEIYINLQYFNKMFSIFYKLQKFKASNRSKSSTDSLYTFYLKKKIFFSVRQHEQKLQKQNIDVDRQIQVEHTFIDYKRLLYESTIQVERFWSTLSKVDYEISEIIKIGQKIVDNYLLTKNLYDEMIDMKPDFKEVVQLQMNFNFEVMNFELEGINLQTLLKNIQQKLMITKQSSYMKQKDNQGFVIISGNPSSRNKILLINQVLCAKVQIQKNDLVGQNISQLMPKIIAQSHDKIVEKYITSHHEKNLSTTLPRVWLKKRNQFLIPCKIEIKPCISETHGLVFVGIFTFDEDINIMNVSSKINEAYILLTDYSGYIQNASENFIQRFMGQDQFAIEEQKENVDDIIQVPENTQQNDLFQGVSAKFIEKFRDTVETQNIMVQVRKFKIPEQIEFKEYAFIECQTSGVVMKSLLKTKYQKKESNEFGDTQDLDQVMLEINASSESGSSKSTELINLKGAIDFKQIPRSLSNLKRAIVIFFCILIGTSFSVLAVTQIQNQQFLDDSTIVKGSIELGGILANLRLVFRMLLLYPRSTIISDRFEFSYLQNQLELYYNRMQQNVFLTLNDKNYQDLELIEVMHADSIKIIEVQQDGSISEHQKKFTLSLQQFMTKVQKFITIDKQLYIEEFKNFKVRTLSKSPTINQRDAYFIIINGMKDIRSFSLKLSQLFVEQSKDKEDIHDQTVLIITMSCIAITLLSSLLLIPVTFALDSEQEDIVKQWMQVSNNAKKDIIQRIDDFMQILLEERKKQQKVMFSQHINYASQIQISFTAASNRNKLELDQLQLYSQELKLSDSNIELQESQFDQTHIGFFNNHSLQNKYMQSVVNKEDFQVHPHSSMNNQISLNKQQLFSQNFSIQNAEQPKPQDKQEEHKQQKDENIKVQRAFQKVQLRKIYRNQKAFKIVFILIFATIIFGFYISFYFISSQVFQSAKDSFTFLTNTNRRAPCLSNVYQLLLETYTLNSTLYIGYDNETVMSHAQNTCMVYEKNVQNYQANPPPQMVIIEDFMKDINSKELCNLTFENDIIQQLECLKFKNGMLKNGFANTMNSLFYYLFSELIEFDTFNDKQWRRTELFLDDHTYSQQTLDNVKMILKFILPAAEIMKNKVDYALKTFMNSQIDQFIIVFTFFLVFLVVSLYLSLGKLINHLKKDVFRSRVLVKIIPADELQQIHKRQRQKENKRRYQYQNQSKSIQH